MNRMPSKPEQPFSESMWLPRVIAAGPAGGSVRDRAHVILSVNAPARPLRRRGEPRVSMGSIVDDDMPSFVRPSIRSAIMLPIGKIWDGWLTHCDDAFQYAIRCWSPEINRT